MRILLVCIVFLLCGQGSGLMAQSAKARLDTIVKQVQDYQGYDWKQFPMGLFTEEYYRQEAEFAQAKLDELNQLDPTALKETDAITLSLLKFRLQDEVSNFDFDMHLNPLLSDAGFHSSFTYMVRPIANYEQAKAYLNRLKAMEAVVDQHFVILRKGLEKGISQPRVIFEGYESTYNDHIVEDYKESFYYSPFLSLPEQLTQHQRDSVLGAAKQVVEEVVTPSFKRIKGFFETEYLPNTRTAIGASAMPNGAAFYQNRINYYTTSTQYTADDIHQIGLNEVARIKAEMMKIIKEVEFEGDFEAFLEFLRTDPQFYAESPKELLMIARDMAKRADEQLPKFFKTLPRTPYGVAPVPDAIAPKYTGGRYIPTYVGSTNPGYYWVNTYDLPSRPLYVMPALTVHEAVPGHHLQMALNMELGDSIPQFRRNMYLSAYGEGWGLYTEYLAAEMGMYTTPYERFGQLTYEMWRACRLVVDTGIHAKGWTRQQVVDYMAGNTALSLHEVNTETDRYISWPGQALSYKIGELKIRELRQKAEAELGEDFDIRQFHEVILEQGTVTLSILEDRINNYIQQTASSDE